MLYSKILHNLRLIWTPICSAYRSRHLLWEFTSREIRGRFAGTSAGTLWALINPLATIIVYQFVFSIVLRVQVTAEETGTNSFLIYFLSGLFPWMLFSDSILRSVGCLVGNANLITKVVFPVELLPASTVLSTFIMNGIGMLIFLGYLLFAGYLHPTCLFVILLVPLQILFSVGLAYLLAGVCVFLRDIGELINIVLMVWFFSTPVIYPISMVPASLRPVFDLNPMTAFITLYREILLLHRIDWILLLHVFLLAVISYAVGAWFFMRARPAFGDVL